MLLTITVNIWDEVEFLLGDAELWNGSFRDLLPVIRGRGCTPLNEVGLRKFGKFVLNNFRRHWLASITCKKTNIYIIYTMNFNPYAAGD